MNVASHKANHVKTHQGKAILIVQSIQDNGAITVSASTKEVKSDDLRLSSN